MPKRAFLISGFLIVMAVGGLAWIMQSHRFHGSVMRTPKLEGGTLLRSADGPVNLSEFQGKIVLLYFGYTFCPDVCPTSLAKLKSAISELTPEEQAQVQVVFVSVDTDRDTPEKLKKYAHAFSNDFIGATGTRSEIDLITESLGVYYKIGPPDSNGNYTVDHSSYMYVIDRQGYLVMSWGNDNQADEISADLSYLLEHGISVSSQILAGPTQTPVVCSLTLVPLNVDAGQWHYEQHCAQCHGLDLAGNAGWQTELADGSHLAPPLNQTGNAWKYSKQDLAKIVKEGYNLDKPINMPSFKYKLGDREIDYTLQYIASKWDVNQRNYQAGFFTLTPNPTVESLPTVTLTPTP
jgi:protein SCO1/2